MLVELIKKHARKLAVALCAGALIVAGLFCSFLVPASYDLTLSRTLSPAPLTNAAIVYLDLESYLNEKQSPDAPWDRGLHARLLSRLTRANAKAVVFDIIFDQPGKDAAADADFAAAIRANGRVILAAEREVSSRRKLDELGSRDARLVLPWPSFREAAAAWGLAKFIVDDDFVVRRYFPGLLSEAEPSLSWAVANFLKLPALSARAPGRNAAWVRYYGPPLTIPHVSYSDALDPNAVADDFFRGKVIFVGARPIAGGFRERKDEFRTPFSASQDRDLFMPAVEIHATEMLNLLRSDWLRRLPFAEEEWLLIASAFCVSALLIRFRPVPAAGLALAAELLVLVFRETLWRQGIWFPWLIVCAVQIPGALGGSILFHSIEWYRTRRRLEAQRREAEARIREQAELIDKAQDAILVQDLQGLLLYVNSSAKRLYGWSDHDWRIADTSQHLIATAEGKRVDARAEVLQKGEWLGELEQTTRDGRKIIVESRWTLIRDEAGNKKSILLINTDVTEKKRLEVQFLRAQRMDTIGALAGGMAHDLNNALAPILMGIQLIGRKPHDQETQELLSVMEASTFRGADMVRQVLTFSRGRDGDLELLNVARLVREMEHLTRQTFPKSIQISVMAARDLWPILGNATQIHQVLLNLCVNARDAMPNGGELILAADNVDLTNREAEAIPNASSGQYVMLLVSDTGIGIEPQMLSRIFEPFVTSKAPGKGAGLGLSTVTRIVANHAGFVNVRSERGLGTNFEIYFPRAEAAGEQRIIRGTGELPAGRGEQLLVIDDDRSVLEMLASTLAEHGYQVVAAANGEEALAFLEDNEREFRVILADLTIPAIDGKNTLDLIRIHCPGVPMILMSGSVDSPQEGSRLTPALFLQKPFGLDQVLTGLATALAREVDQG